MKSKKTVELYNSEGPCLAANRIGQNLYQIVDQWKHPLKNVSAVGLLCIYHGIETVTDTSGRVWDLGKEKSGGAKPHLEEILMFLRENEKETKI